MKDSIKVSCKSSSEGACRDKEARISFALEEEGGLGVCENLKNADATPLADDPIGYFKQL